MFSSILPVALPYHSVKMSAPVNQGTSETQQYDHRVLSNRGLVARVLKNSRVVDVVFIALTLWCIL